MTWLPAQSGRQKRPGKRPQNSVARNMKIDDHKMLIIDALMVRVNDDN
jgi:hypothetical protein